MKNISISLYILIIFFTIASPQSQKQKEYEKYKQEKKKEFLNYQKNITLEYEKYLLSEMQAFNDYKNKVEQKWEEYREPTKKVFVKYNDNLENRISVDFETGLVTVEVLLDKDEQNIENAHEKIKEAIVTIVEEKAEDHQPILMNQLSSIDKQNITPKNVKVLSGTLIKKENISIDDSHYGKDRVERKLYTAIIPMRKNHLSIRIKKYEQIILSNTMRFNIDPAIIFAIIETESAFNPKAKSHAPAYGLMQLVPQTGARDAYNYIYKRDKLLKSGYLYDPVKNIELGCAYFSMIRYEYFDGINDDVVSDICAIPAYNTGIGNVSVALSGVPITSEAVKTVNRLSANEVYSRLKSRLKSPEAREYIDKVWERKEKYVHYRRNDNN